MCKSINMNFDSPCMCSSCSDWAGLPKELVELIADKIESSVHYLRFGAVCVPWLSVVRDNLSKHNAKFRHQAPLLLIPDKHKRTWRAYDVMKDKFLESKLRVPYERRFCGSSEEGWLVGVNKDSSVTLHKPGYTYSNVRLPRMQFPRGFGLYFMNDAEVSAYHVKRAIVKSDEKAESNELAVVARYGEFNDLAFIRHGKDATWSNITYDNPWFKALDVLHYNNQFYAINFWDDLVAFNGTDSFTRIELVAPKTAETECCNKYLVKSCGGELLLVKRYTDWPKVGDLRVRGSFLVYRCDFDGKKWIEVTSLGGTALFLGDSFSISVLASNFPGCQPNCIYFTHDNDDLFWEKTMIYDLGVYNLESKSFRSHNLIDPTTLMGTSDERLPIWFVPRIIL